TDRYGDERRTRIVRADGDLSDEDLIPDEDMVVTITHGGYAKRTRADQYRLQKRGGKGVRGASLRVDDEVGHLFTTTSHHWLLFFTNFGRVYRTKVWQLPESGRDAKGGHVAGLLSFLPDEKIAQVLTIRSYEDAPYLLLATKRGLVKKSELTAYDSPRQAGLIAINFRDEDDELIGAATCSASDDVLLISRKGQAIRFSADDEQLRPMGRATSGVMGMRFRRGDELLSMAIIDSDMDTDGRFVFTVTDGGFAKRTAVSEYRVQGRGGLGIKAMKLSEDRGRLVGGLVVTEEDEVIAIKHSGQVIRSAVSEVPSKGRDTMGVRFVGLTGGDAVSAIALYPEPASDPESEAESDEKSTTVGESGPPDSDSAAAEEETDE
ncbi:MAG: DNA gyrase subunit A, partial [Propionibacterium sp.]|nr:DNA gyrase subunit A [Propionibacterium sp.]